MKPFSLLQNQWFQLAALTAVMSGGISLYDLLGRTFKGAPSTQYSSAPSAASSKATPLATPHATPNDSKPTISPAGYIGVVMNLISKDGGVFVDNVVPGSPAEMAKIGKGDIIKKLGGRNTRESTDLQKIVSETEIGQKLECEIVRDSEPLKLVVEVRAQPDPEKMFQNYLHAAEAGDIDSEYGVAGRYMNGQGIPKNESEAAKWYLKAAEKGHALAQNSLGLCYFFGNGPSKDSEQAVKWFLKSAEQGNYEAQRNLGLLYHSGEEVKKDDTEAAKWFLKAAEQGDVIAASNIGDLYASGAGVDKDDVEAARWFRKAAEQGNAYAQASLGLLYYAGQGPKKNNTEAFTWFQKAAEQNYVSAQFYMGRMYQEGEGVKKDTDTAIYWYLKAAEQGSIAAQNNLGCIYNSDEDLHKNPVEAVKWFQKAAEQNDADGEYNLGIAFVDGNGVKKDISQAVSWLQKAKDQGHENAAAVLEKIKTSNRNTGTKKTPEAIPKEETDPEEAIRIKTFTENPLSFLESYLSSGETNADGLLMEIDFYSDKVDYFDNGILTRKAIEKDIEDYKRRWPARAFSIVGKPIVKVSAGAVTYDYVIKFDVNSGQRGVRGKTATSMKVNTIGGKWQITSVHSKAIASEKYILSVPKE